VGGVDPPTPVPVDELVLVTGACVTAVGAATTEGAAFVLLLNVGVAVGSNFGVIVGKSGITAANSKVKRECQNRLPSDPLLKSTTVTSSNMVPSPAGLKMPLKLVLGSLFVCVIPSTGGAQALAAWAFVPATNVKAEGNSVRIKTPL